MILLSFPKSKNQSTHGSYLLAFTHIDYPLSFSLLNYFWIYPPPKKLIVEKDSSDPFCSWTAVRSIHLGNIYFHNYPNMFYFRSTKQT